MTVIEAIRGKVSPYSFAGMRIEKLSDTKIHIKTVEGIVCRYYRIDRSLLHGHNRRRDIVKARQTIMYLCRIHTDFSLKAIGNYFGGFDHTTVIHAINTVKNIMDTEEDYRNDINFLTTYFKSE